ncbi:MAG: AtpZ/AtpI family protein [Mariniblastus sp.]
MDDRSAHAKAMSSVARITTISMMMVIPAFVGFYIDSLLGTKVLFMFLGMAFGMGSGVWQLMKLVNYQNQVDDSSSEETESALHRAAHESENHE